MKSLILICVLASFAAHAADTKLVSKDGSTVVTPVTATARTYTNAKGISQVDMLFESSSTIVLQGTKRHLENRKRMAFTGCGNTTGLAFEVDPDGNPRLPDGLLTDEWVSGGNKMVDGMAAIACKAAPHLAIAAPAVANAATPPTDAANLPMLGVIPNLSDYNNETRQSMEIACVSERTKGPAAYGACLSGQIAAVKSSPGIPSLNDYDRETRQSMEIACVSERVKGPVAYGACLRGQIAAVRSSPGIPSLNDYDRDTRQSMEIACVSERVKGPVTYGSCLNRQIAALSSSPGIPSLSSYDRDTRQSMELACVSEKVQGPVAYGACLRRHVESLGPPRSN